MEKNLLRIGEEAAHTDTHKEKMSMNTEDGTKRPIRRSFEGDDNDPATENLKREAENLGMELVEKKRGITRRFEYVYK